jgi:hypothetical protein
MTEEQREYYRKYYQKHKQQRKDDAREYYYKSKGLSDEEARLKRNEKARDYYRSTHPKINFKAEIQHLKDKYKGFKFKYDGTVLSFEIKLPFRIMVEEYGAKRCDDKEYARLQNILRRRLNEVDDSNKIVVLECGYIDAHITNMEKADEICEVCRDFVKEQLEIYGSYIKNGRKVGEHFE